MRVSFKPKSKPRRGKRQSQSRLMGVMLFVAASVAFIVGWFFVITGAEHLVMFARSRSWVTVPAIVEAAGIQKTGTRGHSRVTATYRYVYDGREYTGTRVGLARGGDNFSSWTDRTYSRLAAAREGGEPVDCYVNPNRPEQAVLDRALRPGVLLLQLGLGLPFAAFGTLLWVVFAVIAVSKVRRCLWTSRE